MPQPCLQPRLPLTPSRPWGHYRAQLSLPGLLHLPNGTGPSFSPARAPLSQPQRCCRVLISGPTDPDPCLQADRPPHPHSPAWPTRVVADPGAPHQALILTLPQLVPMKVPVDDNSRLPLAAIIPCRPCSLPQVLWDRPCPAAMLWLPAPLPQGAASLHRSLPALHLLISSF